MKVTLDHITIRTHYLQEVKNFFIDIFELLEGSRPKQIERIPGYWLYAGKEPIVHLIGSRGISKEFTAEAYDHIGIRAEGYSKFLEKLQKKEIGYSLMDLEDINERRIFFRAPGGLLVEAVFRDEKI